MCFFTLLQLCEGLALRGSNVKAIMKGGQSFTSFSCTDMSSGVASALFLQTAMSSNFLEACAAAEGGGVGFGLMTAKIMSLEEHPS